MEIGEECGEADGAYAENRTLATRTLSRKQV